MAEQDGLTGISNRRRFDRAFDQAFRNAARTGECIGLAMSDVDHFKQYNDHYGHGAGDEVLRQVAWVIADFAQRPYNMAARYGGEEFVLPSRTADVITVSCGGIVLEKLNAEEPHGFLQQADQLLHEAKQQGRNRVVVRQMVSLSRTL